MQHIFIELWSLKDEWKQLSEGDRAAYVERLLPEIQAVTAQGVEIVAWGYNARGIDRRVDYDVFAVYRVPSAEVLAALQQAVVASGWYDYFEHVNAGGAVLPPPAILADHVQLTAAPDA